MKNGQSMSNQLIPLVYVQNRCYLQFFFIRSLLNQAYLLIFLGECFDTIKNIFSHIIDLSLEHSSLFCINALLLFVIILPTRKEWNNYSCNKVHERKNTKEDNQARKEVVVEKRWGTYADITVEAAKRSVDTTVYPKASILKSSPDVSPVRTEIK